MALPSIKIQNVRKMTPNDQCYYLDNSKLILEHFKEHVSKDIDDKIMVDFIDYVLSIGYDVGFIEAYG